MVSADHQASPFERFCLIAIDCDIIAGWAVPTYLPKMRARCETHCVLRPGTPRGDHALPSGTYNLAALDWSCYVAAAATGRLVSNVTTMLLNVGVRECGSAWRGTSTFASG